MEKRSGRRLGAHLRRLRLLTLALVEHDQLHLPVYLHAVVVCAIASFFYTLGSLIPRVDDLTWPFVVLGVCLAAALVGQVFWMLVLRHTLRWFGLESRLPIPSEAERRLARHVRPDFDEDGVVRSMLRYAAGVGYMFLYMVEQAEAWLIESSTWKKASSAKTSTPTDWSSGY